MTSTPVNVDLIEQSLEITGAGGSLPVFATRGKLEKDRPAVIIIHEIFGLNDHIKDVARRFARAGFVACAPDLFAYSQGLPGDRNDLNAMRQVWQEIPDGQLIADLQAVFAWLAKSPGVIPDKIGTIGFCMGGAISLMFACSTAPVSWIADYYGRIYYPETSQTKPKHPIDYIDQLQCPVLALFAGQDELITEGHIAKLEEKLKKQGKPYTLKVYLQAKHAFFNDTRPFYDAEAAVDAWNLTLDFIEKSSRVSLIR